MQNADITRIIERLKVISWITKDLGWMATNIFLGWSFGFLSVICHTFLLLYEKRRSFLYYNISLVLWVLGNFIWMTVEFTSVIPSSTIRLYSNTKVPTGGISPSNIILLTKTKTFLFVIAMITQIIMYIGIYYGKISMPEDDDDDKMSNEEANSLCGIEKDSYYEDKEFAENYQIRREYIHNHNYSIIYIENLYIFFWIMKDLFWSCGTGDIPNLGAPATFLYESIAIVSGTLSLTIYIITAYLYRKSMIHFIDSISTIFWLLANFVWMCGEFFLRYNHLQNDDINQGNDSFTRVISLILFLLGIIIQVYIVFMAIKKIIIKLSKRNNNIDNFIEMINIRRNSFKNNNNSSSKRIEAKNRDDYYYEESEGLLE